VIRTGSGAIVGALATALFWVFGRLSEAPQAIKTVSRRNFVRNAALASVLIVVGQLAFGFVRFFWPNKTGAFGSEITVPNTDIPRIGENPYRNTAGKFYIMHLDDGLIALYWKCPHLGCTVPWVPAEDHFHCPCHGSVYLRNGVKIAGPAPRPLDLFAITLSPAGDVLVDTGTPILRTDYEPSQAVPYTG
jgi:cytochrome b6-f complex iron-sulfur subunit